MVKGALGFCLIATCRNESIFKVNSGDTVSKIIYLLFNLNMFQKRAYEESV